MPALPDIKHRTLYAAYGACDHGAAGQRRCCIPETVQRGRGRGLRQREVRPVLSRVPGHRVETRELQKIIHGAQRRGPGFEEQSAAVWQPHCGAGRPK